MSVDNFAILFLGLPDSDLDLDIPEDTYFHTSIDKFLKDHNAQDSGIDWVRTNQDELLIGIEIANSGNYGSLEVPDLEQRLAEKRLVFQKIFGKILPKIYLLEIQG